MNCENVGPYICKHMSSLTCFALILNLNCCNRRANFTSADMRESDFSGSTFNGAYMEKAVAYKANFSGKDLNQY